MLLLEILPQSQVPIHILGQLIFLWSYWDLFMIPQHNHLLYSFLKWYSKACLNFLMPLFTYSNLF